MPGDETDRDSTVEARLARIEERLAAAPPAREKSPIERALKLLPLLAASNFLVAVPAFVISLAVAYFSFIQAEATDKMQIAAVWPHIAYETTNRTDDGAPIIRLSLTNKGVGPASVRGLELRYQGRPYARFRDLLGACCSDDPQALALGLGSAVGEVVRPGETIMFAQIDRAKVPAEVWDRFDAARLKLDVRLCYCSVFDDCWLANTAPARPQPVKACPADWTEFYAAPQLAPPAR